MGKRGGSRKSSNLSHCAVSLREESTGKLQSKASVCVKNMLKFEHLQKLAIWVSRESSTAPLSGFFGHHLASVGESLGIPPDPSLFPCQRCETILQPGFNCTVRIEKNTANARHRRKKNVGISQNNVSYKCHFCSHSNLLRGTPKGHMKDICLSNQKSSSKANHVPALPMKPCKSDETIENKIEVHETNPSSSPVDVASRFGTDVGTPPVKQVTSLLDGSKRKRNRSGKKAVEPIAAISEVKTAGTSNKRKRRCWTSLKEIAQSSENDKRRNVDNFSIPFVL